MKSNIIRKIGNTGSQRLTLVIVLTLLAASLSAQTPADFTGTWIQDNAKSDDFYKGFNVSMVISQTPQVFAVQLIFADKDNKEMTKQESAFNLDGKEVSKEEHGGINKELATWSADKKTLTTKSTRTVGTDVYGSITTYTLSADGKVLTKHTSDVNPLGPSINQVFNRK